MSTATAARDKKWWETGRKYNTADEIREWWAAVVYEDPTLAQVAHQYQAQALDQLRRQKDATEQG